MIHAQIAGYPSVGELVLLDDLPQNSSNHMSCLLTQHAFLGKKNLFAWQATDCVSVAPFLPLPPSDDFTHKIKTLPNQILTASCFYWHKKCSTLSRRTESSLSMEEYKPRRRSTLSWLSLFFHSMPRLRLIFPTRSEAIRLVVLRSIHLTWQVFLG